MLRPLLDVSGLGAFSLCFVVGLAYVVSLYVWTNTLNRDEPSIIRKRSLSTLVVSVIGVVLVRLNSTGWSASAHKLGISGAFWPNVRSCFIGLLLTATLFAGPLCQPAILCTAPSYFNMATDWLMYQPRWLLLRNFIISPVTEELVFRAVFIALLDHAFGSVRAVLLASMLFSLAHLHHLIEAFSYNGGGGDLLQALGNSLVQASYTLLFGIYAGYLFVSTGSLLCCVIVHAFCNFIGPPALGEFFLTAEILNVPEPVLARKRAQLLFVYVVGFVVFCVMVSVIPRVFAL